MISCNELSTTLSTLWYNHSLLWPKNGSGPSFGKCSGKRRLTFWNSFNDWIQRVIAFHWTAIIVDYELQLITKNLRYRQGYTSTPQNFAEIYFRRVNYPSFWPFLEYPTLYPRSMPITIKLGILPYCGSPESRTHTDSKPQHSWGRSGTQVSASQTQLTVSVTQFFCRVHEA